MKGLNRCLQRGSFLSSLGATFKVKEFSHPWGRRRGKHFLSSGCSTSALLWKSGPTLQYFFPNLYLHMYFWIIILLQINITKHTFLSNSPTLLCPSSLVLWGRWFHFKRWGHWGRILSACSSASSALWQPTWISVRLEGLVSKPLP